MDTFPNFLIIGAQKAGTSSLYQYIRQHPDVFMAFPKEPEFFALEGRNMQHKGPDGCTPNENENPYTELGRYTTLFEEVDGETAIGEASTLYLYSPQAPSRIQQYIPNAKLIAILRNPIDRAYSAFLMAKREGLEPLSFEEALEAEEERIENGWGYLWRYKDFGRYNEQLRRYTERFDDDQIQIFLLDDLRNDVEAVVRQIFHFVGVDDAYTPDLSLQHNKGGVPRSSTVSDVVSSESTLKTVLKWILPADTRERIRHAVRDANLHKPTLDPDTRKALTESYREEILKLQDLIDRDLSHWLNPDS